MKHWLRSHPWRAAALVLLALAASALVATGRTPFYTPAYTPKTMSTITAERRTHCLGRYLVDLPADFTQFSGGWGAVELYYGLDKDFETVYASVEPELFTPAQFYRQVEAREKELRETINSATHAPMLLHAERIGNLNVVMFRRMDVAHADDGAIKSEVHQLIGGRYVRYEQESYDIKNLEAGGGRASYRNIDPTPAEDRLKMIARKLRPEETGGRGFCFQGVIFDVGQDDEVGSFYFGSKTVRDLFLRIDYHAVTGQPKEGLFERTAQNTPVWMKPMIVTLRQRHRQLGGMNAEEGLERFTLSSSDVQHGFKIETRTEHQSLARPMIGIEMRTGDEVEDDDGKQVQPKGQPSLSDDQALKLWDDIVNSVRVRPGA